MLTSASYFYISIILPKLTSFKINTQSIILFKTFFYLHQYIFNKNDCYTLYTVSYILLFFYHKVIVYSFNQNTKFIFSCQSSNALFWQTKTPTTSIVAGIFYYTNSQNQFCIDNLLLFHFICFQLSHFYSSSPLVLSISCHEIVIKLEFIDALLNPVKRISSFQKEMQESIAKFFFNICFSFSYAKKTFV